MLPGIGGKGAEKLWERFITEWASRCGELIGDAVVVQAPVSAPVSDLDGELEDAPPVPEGPRIPVAPVLAALQSVVPKRAAAAWAQFIATLAQGENPARAMSPADLIRHVVEATYKEYVEANYDRAPRRLEELEQLALYAAQFQSVSDFLSQLALQTNLEADESAKEGDDEERLRLSTVHQAKGLEFGAVFVIMLSDGCFPTQRAVDAADALEEERRLFYVAATRGKDELYLLYPLTRMFQGSLALQSPSRFLQEIPQELMEEWRLRGAPAWGNGPMTPLPGLEGDVDEPPF
jgi:DNA helicase-2/ATP-dependent DNA helicase PcrA